MAWRCSGNTNAVLVANLQEARLITSPDVIAAMTRVDRGNFAPGSPYADAPQPIGFRATISAPHMHAAVLEALREQVTRPGARVLDVGCGSGYLCAAFVELMDAALPNVTLSERVDASIAASGEPSLSPASSASSVSAHGVSRGGEEGEERHRGAMGTVFGIDYIPELVALSKTNLDKQDTRYLASKRVELICTNGWEGLPAHAPFDAIHVGAGAESMPQALVKQLKVGGRMIIPVHLNPEYQTLVQVDRVGPGEMDFIQKELMYVNYVPLVKPRG